MLPWAAQAWGCPRIGCGIPRSPGSSVPFSYAVARAYAGHTDAYGGSTLTYIKGQPVEVALAMSVLAGQTASACASGSRPWGRVEVGL